MKHESQYQFIYEIRKLNVISAVERRRKHPSFSTLTTPLIALVVIFTVKLSIIHQFIK